MHVVIYTKSWCPYCHAAIALLNKRGIAFEEIVVDYDETLFAQMKQRANGRKTVPQIFFDEIGIGGFNELEYLDREGGLVKLKQKHTIIEGE